MRNAPNVQYRVILDSSEQFEEVFYVMEADQAIQWVTIKVNVQVHKPMQNIGVQDRPVIDSLKLWCFSRGQLGEGSVWTIGC
jgi:hypothetical protein